MVDTPSLVVGITALILALAAGALAVYFEYQKPDVNDGVNDNAFEIAVLKESIEDMQADTVDLSATERAMEDLRQKYNELQAFVTANTQQQQPVQDLLSQFDRLEFDIKDLQNQIDRVNINVNDIEDDSIAPETINVQIQSILHETEKIYDIIDTINDDIEDIEDNVRDLDNHEIRALRSQLDILETNFTVLQGRITAIENHLELIPPTPPPPGGFGN
jgi:uncharacterized protein YoxC